MKRLAIVVTVAVAAVGTFVGLGMVADLCGPTVAGSLVLAIAFFIGTAATGDL